MIEADSRGELREAGVSGGGVEGEVMNGTMRDNRVVTREEAPMVTDVVVTRDTAGATVTQVRGGRIHNSFTVIRENPLVALTLLKIVKVRQQVWKEGTSTIGEVVNGVEMIINICWFHCSQNIQTAQ